MVNAVRPIAAPAVPLPPDKYDRMYFNLLINTLKSFFGTVVNAINVDIATESTVGVAESATGNALDLTQVSNFNVYVAQLTADITSILFPTTVTDGQLLSIRFQQSTAAGPFAISGFPTNVLLAGAYVMSVGGAKYDLITFHYCLDSNLWLEQSRSQNM